MEPSECLAYKSRNDSSLAIECSGPQLHEWDLNNTVTCNSDIDCETAGSTHIYFRCAEFYLNDQPMPGTTKVCLTSAMCEVSAVYGEDTASIVCSAKSFISHFIHLLVAILIIYSF